MDPCGEGGSREVGQVGWVGVAGVGRKDPRVDTATFMGGEGNGHGYGPWAVVSGLRPMVYGLWPWPMAYGLVAMAHDPWLVFAAVVQIQGFMETRSYLILGWFNIKCEMIVYNMAIRLRCAFH